MNVNVKANILRGVFIITYKCKGLIAPVLGVHSILLKISFLLSLCQCQCSGSEVGIFSVFIRF